MSASARASEAEPGAFGEAHLFLGPAHGRNERRTWIAIGLCVATMLLEIGGGLAFGSIALVADGLHMSTHAAVLLLAAAAYGLSRRYAVDPRFSFGTGKLGDLTAFASAVLLAGVALALAWESVARLSAPVPIRLGQAIPIAALGLVVNIACAWLLREDYHHGETEAPDAHRAAHHRDNNLRAVLLHLLADAAVSAMVIAGLVLARLLGWLWIDPVAAVAGSVAIAGWSYVLIRDTGAVLLDMTPDRKLAARIREAVEAQGDRVGDLHLWRLGPGHLAAIVGVQTDSQRDADYYRAQLEPLRAVSHVTVEVNRVPAGDGSAPGVAKAVWLRAGKTA